MTNSTSTHTARQNVTSKPASRTGALRRTIAGIAAAGAIAFGGAGMISPADASAAGVKTQTYVVQSSEVQVASNPTTTRTPKSTY